MGTARPGGLPYLPPQMLDARPSGASGPFGSDDGVADLLAAAGFDEMRTVSFDLTVDVTEVEDWHRFSWSHGQRAMWEAVPEGKRGEVQEAAFAVLERARDDIGRVLLGQRIRLTLGERRS